MIAHICEQTQDSYLLLILVEYLSTQAYRTPRLSTVAQRQFLSGPGEGHPLQGISLEFEGVIQVEGGILRY